MTGGSARYAPAYAPADGLSDTDSLGLAREGLRTSSSPLRRHRRPSPGTWCPTTTASTSGRSFYTAALSCGTSSVCRAHRRPRAGGRVRGCRPTCSGGRRPLRHAARRARHRRSGPPQRSWGRCRRHRCDDGVPCSGAPGDCWTGIADQCSVGKAAKARLSGPASTSIAAASGNRISICSTTRASCSASGCSKIGSHEGGRHRLRGLGHLGEQVANEVRATPLPRRPRGALTVGGAAQRVEVLAQPFESVHVGGGLPPHHLLRVAFRFSKIDAVVVASGGPTRSSCSSRTPRPWTQLHRLTAGGGAMP